MKADLDGNTLPCIICGDERGPNTYNMFNSTNREVFQNSFDRAIIIHTPGNFGSQVHDMSGYLTFIICDKCVIKKSEYMLHSNHDKSDKDNFNLRNAREYFEEWRDFIRDSDNIGKSYRETVLSYFEEEDLI